MPKMSNAEFQELLRDIKSDIGREADEVLSKMTSKIEGIWRDLLNSSGFKSVLLELQLLPNGNLRDCLSGALVAITLLILQRKKPQY
jgi:hypothetical protein